MKEFISASLLEAQTGLTQLINNPQELANIESAAQLIIDSFANGGRVFSCGNGGSMCDAMHFAEELTGRYRKDRRGLPAIAISEAGHMSCVANDFGYDFVFARYIESHARAGDVLLGISTSGNSENIVRAASVAREMGVKVIILTGRSPSRLEALADVYINTPAGQYADRVQELHIKVLHILIELIERKFFPENY